MEQPEVLKPHIDLTDPTPGICDNCGARLYGEYCHHCGQHEKSYIRNVFSLISEFMQEFGSWDSRIMRTLVPLMFRPGFLSKEYVAGRRVRYVPPVRLYLFVSLVFFLSVAMVTNVDTTEWRQAMQDKPAAEAAETAAPIARSEMPVGVQFRDRAHGTLAERITVNIPWLSDTANAEVHRRVVRSMQNPDLLLQQARQLAAPMMFLLLPFFALLLKVLYLFAGRYYTEHFTLALHTHSFIFMSLLLTLALGAFEGSAPWLASSTSFLSTLLLVWIPVYLFLAQKRFYGQGRFFTFIKYCITGFIYIIMISFAAAGLFLVSILTA